MQPPLLPTTLLTRGRVFPKAEIICDFVLHLHGSRGRRERVIDPVIAG
jgi:hypothetical protein